MFDGLYFSNICEILPLLTIFFDLVLSVSISLCLSLLLSVFLSLYFALIIFTFQGISELQTLIEDTVDNATFNIMQTAESHTDQDSLNLKLDKSSNRVKMSIWGKCISC